MTNSNFHKNVSKQVSELLRSECIKIGYSLNLRPFSDFLIYLLVLLLSEVQWQAILCKQKWGEEIYSIMVSNSWGWCIQKKLKNNDYSQTAFLKNKGGIYRCQLQETDQSSRWENWHHNIHSMAHWLSSNHLWSMETDHSNLLLGSMLLCCNAETKNHFIPKHTHTRLTAFCPGLPRWASTRKVKTIWILLKQETVGGSGISWAIMQVCTSLQTDNHTSTPPLFIPKQSRLIRKINPGHHCKSGYLGEFYLSVP